MGNRTFPIAREGNREALSLSTVECIVLLTLWFVILSCFLMLKQTALSLCIGLTGLLFTQSGCTYQKFRAPERLALTLHVCRARVQLNRTLAHLLQPSQGLLNEPPPSGARSDNISQTNRALGLRRTRARFKTPSVGTPLENNRIT